MGIVMMKKGNLDFKLPSLCCLNGTTLGGKSKPHISLALIRVLKQKIWNTEGRLLNSKRVKCQHVQSGGKLVAVSCLSFIC